MNCFYGDANVEYCVPEEFLQAYKYVEDNVHTVEGSISADIVVGCICEGDCSEKDCICLAQSTDNYNRDSTLAFIDDLLTDPYFSKAVFECNSCCICSPSCRNRVVQKGLKFRLRVSETAGKGFGVIAVENIAKGSYVIDYAGELLPMDEARKRIIAKKEDESNYLLTVCENFGEKSVQTFIDAAKFGNVSRFINHSCSPNLLLHPVRVETSIPRLALFAKHDILVGEELSFDYGGGAPNQCRSGTKNVVCCCNAVNCQGFLPAEPLN